jgi:hypothetical protein
MARLGVAFPYPYYSNTFATLETIAETAIIATLPTTTPQSLQPLKDWII